MPSKRASSGDFLKADDRAAVYPWELGDDDLRALAVSEPPPEPAGCDFETECE